MKVVRTTDIRRTASFASKCLDHWSELFSDHHPDSAPLSNHWVEKTAAPCLSRQCLGALQIERHEDFQSSCRTETICHHRSLLVSIQAFNGGLSRSILPIRTYRYI